ncbi:BUD13 homolog [Ambystoma mexicanum]|uniref:BUD13 homolog n=1 Tax=Ambystoma mexicanum TaxID=8296 RepID=UPI0037E9B693
MLLCLQLSLFCYLGYSALLSFPAIGNLRMTRFRSPWSVTRLSLSRSVHPDLRTMAGVRGKAAALSKAEYLKRYLGGDSPGGEEAKKRRKKRSLATRLAKPGGGKGMRIVDDDDVGWKDPPSKHNDAMYEEEDLPVVAEFVDERPKEIKLMEEFRSGNKWKVLQDDREDSQGSDLSVATKSTDNLEVRTREKEIERSSRSPEQSPSRRTRHDSPDSSPSHIPRDISPSAPTSRRKHSDSSDSSDQSPHRKGRPRSSDELPPRRVRHDSPDLSPPRKVRHNSPNLSPPSKRQQPSPDLSPPRKVRHDSPDLSPSRKGRRFSPDSRLLVNKNGENTDRLPKNRRSPSLRHHSSSSDLSPPRNERHDSDSDMTPPRKKYIAVQPGMKKLQNTRGLPTSPNGHKRRVVSASPLRKRPAERSDSDSDLSPPRRQDIISAVRWRLDSDLSPRRRTQKKSSDSDLSPPRRAQSAKDSPLRQQGRSSQASQMLSGGKAGLVSADILRKEKKDSRRKEQENKPLEEESKSAATVFRDKSGRKRDLQAEREEKKRTAGVKSQREEQYAQWGKGLAQQQMQQQNVLDAAKEIDKPLARYIDDQDLDQMLREQERDGDPMANFIKKKKVKEEKNKKVRPRYNGPAPPPNRFDLWPGHRWDGVDRSNGFEQKRFARQADQKAVQEMAYKWSVEDM